MTVSMAVYDEIDDEDGASREMSSKVQRQDDNDGDDDDEDDEEQEDGEKKGEEDGDDPRECMDAPCRVETVHHEGNLRDEQTMKQRRHPTLSEQAKACVKSQHVFDGFDSALAKVFLLPPRSHGWDQWALVLQSDNQVQERTT